MRKKQHRKWKKKNLESIKNFYTKNNDRPEWADEEVQKQKDIELENRRKELILEVKAIHKKNKEGEQMNNNKNNNEVDHEMLKGLAGLAAYDQMKTVNLENSTKVQSNIIDLTKVVQNQNEESETVTVNKK